MDGLVDYCRLQGVDQSYMGGHSRATPFVRRFLVVVAVPTYPMEMLQLEMFHDNCFMRRIEYLKSVVADEVDYIFGLSYYTWSRLADVVGFNVDFVATLRRDSSGAMLHAVTYNNTHSFRQFEQSPFKFAIGDIPRNVAQIRTLVTPIECPVVSKARFCLDKGLHQNGLIRQFRNIAEIPCDSGDVEKVTGQVPVWQNTTNWLRSGFFGPGFIFNRPEPLLLLRFMIPRSDGLKQSLQKL